MYESLTSCIFCTYFYEINWKEWAKVNCVIKNYKNVYIRINSNGKPVTCAEKDKTLFEESKAKNILENLPKTLQRLKFKIKFVSDTIYDNKNITENKTIQSENYIISDQIAQWIEKFGICDDILKEAKHRKNELNKIISNYDRAVNNWLHEVELEKKKMLVRDI